MKKKYKIYWHNKIVFEYYEFENKKIYCIDLKQDFLNFDEFKKHLVMQNYKLTDIPFFRR